MYADVSLFFSVPVLDEFVLTAPYLVLIEKYRCIADCLFSAKIRDFIKGAGI